MQFTIATLAFLVAFAGLAQSTAVGVRNGVETRDINCYTGSSGQATAADLQSCIDKFIGAGNWIDGTAVCAGRSFFLGGKNWNSAGDCMGGCKPCLGGSANLGSDWAKCGQAAGISAECWFGWCPEGKNPGGNSDGSCS
ncbi:hypothetical protein N431DRAFT_559421 [Stipitochalara longipes BDJ]|nr:hypothetical protein N431DRAFT_559421 [Stipitochalara longipes BDJ]